MIALLSALAGFVSAALPECLKLFRDSKDKAHEITLLKLQMEFEQQKQAQANGAAQAESIRHLQAIELQRDTAETVALNARIKDSLVGIAWVDALAGSVRPVLTYGFCLIYALMKWAQFHMLLQPALPWQEVSAQQALLLLWGEDDVALFTAVVGFWFGHRALLRSRRAGGSCRDWCGGGRRSLRCIGKAISPNCHKWHGAFALK